MYIAHKNRSGEEQSLCQHLNNVARLCSSYASVFGAEEHAYRTGLLHDIGKYAPDVQERMRDPEHTPKRNHTSAGAQTAYKLRDLPAVFAIAGHHGGLQDFSALRSGKLEYQPEDFSDYKKEIYVQSNIQEPKWIKNKLQLSFYTRMLFSCLVDADYLDTESFMTMGQSKRGLTQAQTADLLDKLEQYIKPWSSPSSALNKMRYSIHNDCRKRAVDEKGLFSLTVPTGGGKTVSSLLFAIIHALRHNMSRIIYVVPYTNIIEQTASVFAKILGEENVLEHHSGILCDFAQSSEDITNERQLKKQLATENWDAPIIVTTSVQFFESIYHHQTSSSRKLHNIANSVIIFDEAQMMPLKYLKPCLFAISELVQHYGVSAVLCTATQPDLHRLFEEYIPQYPVREIANNPDKLQQSFRRVTYQEDAPYTFEELAKRLHFENSALCIVNTRASAQALFRLLKSPNCFHLSTWMTPRHRKRVLQIISERLRSGLPCIVVSTSLIEAGVDLDFPTVYRERAGLDSILQSGGRCNREGKRRIEESVVHIFDFADIKPSPDLRQRINAFQYAVEDGDAIDSLAAVKRFSAHTIFSIGDGSDKYRILEDCEKFNFETASHNFHLISDEESAAVCVPCKENEDLIRSVQNGDYDYRSLRALQKDCISISRSEAEHLLSTGSLLLTKSGLLLLQDSSRYTEAIGLVCDISNGNSFFL